MHLTIIPPGRGFPLHSLASHDGLDHGTIKPLASARPKNKRTNTHEHGHGIGGELIKYIRAENPLMNRDPHHYIFYCNKLSGIAKGTNLDPRLNEGKTI